MHFPPSKPPSSPLRPLPSCLGSFSPYQTICVVSFTTGWSLLPCETLLLSWILIHQEASLLHYASFILPWGRCLPNEVNLPHARLWGLNTQWGPSLPLWGSTIPPEPPHTFSLAHLSSQGTFLSSPLQQFCIFEAAPLSCEVCLSLSYVCGSSPQSATYTVH